MNYFKVLRWLGGEGGDALLYAALASNPTIKSNVAINKSQIDNNGRTIIDKLSDLPINIQHIIDRIELVNCDVLHQDFNALKTQGDWLIKSHYYGSSYETINIVPSDITVNFFFAARYSKIPLRYLARSPDDFKLIIKNKNEFIETEKELISNRLKKFHITEKDILIDDIIGLKYNILEDKLGLKIQDKYKSFIKKWVENQKQLFPKELVDFS